MPNTRWRNPGEVGAGLCAVALGIVLLRFVVLLVDAFRRQSLHAYFELLFASPWAVATLVDYIAGSVVAAFWIGCHPIPLVPPLWNSIWALLMPFLGNPALVLYIIGLLIRERSVLRVFTPFHIQQVQREAPSMSAKPSKFWMFSAVFGLTFVVYFGCLLRAWLTEDLMHGYQILKSEPLVLATFLDNLMGIAFAAAVILSREGLTLIALFWVVALLLLGHGIFCMYAMAVLTETVDMHCTFGEAFTSSKAEFNRTSQYV